MNDVQAAEARRLAVAAMITALDGRDRDIPDLLADADRETLIVAAGGLALAVAAIASMVPAEAQAQLRAELAGVAMTMASW